MATPLEQDYDAGRGGGSKGWMRRLVGDIDDYAKENEQFETDGCGFIVHLVSLYWGIRGLVENLVDASIYPLFIAMQVDTELGQELGSRIWLPFSMKPIMGLISDLLPIGKYKKRWYLTIIGIVGTVCLCLLGTWSYEDLGGSQANGAFTFFFCIIFTVAFADTLTQGKYSEVAKAKGSSVISFTYGSKVGASLLGFVIGGYLNDFDPQTTVLLAVPFFFQLIPVAALNKMGDARRKRACAPDCELLLNHSRIFILGVGIFCVALSVSFWTRLVGLFPGGNDLDSTTRAFYRIYFGVGSCAFLLLISFKCLPFSIARINVYLWLCRVMGIQYTYALQQWFTSPPGVCEGSPNFPTVVYQSMGQFMSASAQLFAVWLFEKYVVHWRAPFAFWVTTVFTTVGACFDIMMVTGTNRVLLSWTGLSNVTFEVADRVIRMDDIVLFLFGTQAIRNLADTLDNMPSTLLLSKLCPKGVEATVFAVLVAFFNLGGSMSGQIGARYLGWTGFNIKYTNFTHPQLIVDCPINATPGEICTEEPICDFGQGHFGMNGIVSGLLIGGILLPLLTIPLTWIFIPNIRLDEDFVADVDAEFDLNAAEDSARGATLMPGGSRSSVAAPGLQHRGHTVETLPAGMVHMYPEPESQPVIMPIPPGGMRSGSKFL